MTVQQRALIIAMVGPAMQAIGIAWELVHLLLHHVHRPMLARHIIFEPAVLLIVSGFAVTLVCVPLALEVARARPEDVEMPSPAAEDEADFGGEGAWRSLPR